MNTTVLANGNHIADESYAAAAGWSRDEPESENWNGLVDSIRKGLDVVSADTDTTLTDRLIIMEQVVAMAEERITGLLRAGAANRDVA
jgi:hypothetical protein